MEGVHDVLIIGGGLAGLVSAIELAGAGHNILLIEKKQYPFHKVCGEYVSNEVLPYLQTIGFTPHDFGAAHITRLRVSTPAGKSLYAPLTYGGFGLSRYIMDSELAALAQKKGANLLTGIKVTDIKQNSNGLFEITCSNGNEYKAKLAIGSWGKRDMLDKKLTRSFLNRHTGYMGVKYHVRVPYPANEVGLDNFPGGYCGITKIEGDEYNLCYLYRHKPGAHPYGTIPQLEEKVLGSNPVLKNLFAKAEFVSRTPEVINEICFSPKTLRENGILLCGDSAGLITPLCGNGMSMAITTGRMLSKLIIQQNVLNGKDISVEQHEELYKAYAHAWQQQFGNRLRWGRLIQDWFGNPAITGAVLNTIHAVKPLERWLIRQTHGEVL